MEICYSFQVYTTGSAKTLHFGNLTRTTSPSGHESFLGKINQNGSWEWVEKVGDDTQCPYTMNVDSSNNIWVTAYT